MGALLVAAELRLWLRLRPGILWAAAILRPEILSAALLWLSPLVKSEGALGPLSHLRDAHSVRPPDDYVAYPTSPIYAADLAGEFDVSVRTLSGAVDQEKKQPDGSQISRPQWAEDLRQVERADMIVAAMDGLKHMRGAGAALEGGTRLFMRILRAATAAPRPAI
jgi:hypothetical protein